MVFQKRKRDLDNEDVSIESIDSAVEIIQSLIDRFPLDADIFHTSTDSELPGLLVGPSRATYKAIAKYVGLEPVEKLKDIKYFGLHRARIPNSLFNDIALDIFLLAKQYGFPSDHTTEEATSRFLFPIFNRLVGKFDGLMTNEPESRLPGGRGKGRIEYQFRSFGALTVLFIEVKLTVGGLDERLNAVAQVIAASSACDKRNKDSGLHRVIYGILCDGASFQFFSLDGSTSTPTFLQGEVLEPLPSGRHNTRLILPDMERADYLDFIVALRPICETVFYLLLQGYTEGLKAYSYQLDRERGIAGERRESPNRWLETINFAESTMMKAREAALLSKGGNLDGAEVASLGAFELLTQSLQATPKPKLVRDVLADLASQRALEA